MRLKADCSLRRLKEPVRHAITPRTGPINVMPGNVQIKGIPTLVKLLMGWKMWTQKINVSRMSIVSAMANRKKSE